MSWDTDQHNIQWPLHNLNLQLPFTYKLKTITTKFQSPQSISFVLENLSKYIEFLCTFSQTIQTKKCFEL